MQHCLGSPRFFLSSLKTNCSARKAFRLSRSSLLLFKTLLIPPDDCQVEEESQNAVLALSCLALATMFVTQQDKFLMSLASSVRDTVPHLMENCVGSMSQLIPIAVYFPRMTSFVDTFADIGNQLEAGWMHAALPVEGYHASSLKVSCCTYIDYFVLSHMLLGHISDIAAGTASSRRATDGPCLVTSWLCAR